MFVWIFSFFSFFLSSCFCSSIQYYFFIFPSFSFTEQMLYSVAHAYRLCRANHKAQIVYFIISTIMIIQLIHHLLSYFFFALLYSCCLHQYRQNVIFCRFVDSTEFILLFDYFVIHIIWVYGASISYSQLPSIQMPHTKRTAYYTIHENQNVLRTTVMNECLLRSLVIFSYFNHFSSYFLQFIWTNANRSIVRIK